jgi:hypothetical protein
LRYASARRPPSWATVILSEAKDLRFPVWKTKTLNEMPRVVISLGRFFAAAAGSEWQMVSVASAVSSFWSFRGRTRIQINCHSQPAPTRTFLDSSLGWNDRDLPEMTARAERCWQRKGRVKNPRLRPPGHSVFPAKAGTHSASDIATPDYIAAPFFRC